jgi:hypothetical protein
MNQIILSLGGISRINGSCPLDATDEQLAAFLDAIEYVQGREKITVAQVRERQAQVTAEAAFREKEARSIDALRYLASTDWYVVRQQETGKAIPAEVLAERQKARDSIK